MSLRCHLHTRLIYENGSEREMLIMIMMLTSQIVLNEIESDSTNKFHKQRKTEFFFSIPRKLNTKYTNYYMNETELE